MKELKEHLNESLQPIDEGLMEGFQTICALIPALWAIYHAYMSNRGSWKDAWFKIRGLLSKEDVMTMKNLRSLMMKAKVNNSNPSGLAGMFTSHKSAKEYKELVKDLMDANHVSAEEAEQMLLQASKNKFTDEFFYNAQISQWVNFFDGTYKRSNVLLWRNCVNVIRTLCDAPNRTYEETQCMLEVIDRVLKSSRASGNALKIPQEDLDILFELRDVVEMELIEYDEANNMFHKKVLPAQLKPYRKSINIDFRHRNVKVNQSALGKYNYVDEE